MDSSFENYYNKALKFLSYRPRSEKEVKDNLLKKKAQSSIADLIINKLKEQRFLDDKEFAKWWIEQRTIVKPTGFRIIKIELKRKGINRELIEEILENSDFLAHNELEMARGLVEKRIGRLKVLPREKIYNRLGGFLSRRGFDYDIIKKVIDEKLREGV